MKFKCALKITSVDKLFLNIIETLVTTQLIPYPQVSISRAAHKHNSYESSFVHRNCCMNERALFTRSAICSDEYFFEEQKVNQFNFYLDKINTITFRYCIFSFIYLFIYFFIFSVSFHTYGHHHCKTLNAQTLTHTSVHTLTHIYVSDLD